MNPQIIAIIAVVVNILLTVGKVVFGILVGSAAILAEAIHSALDIFSSFITFLGVRLAQKPSDKKHPYGYYRAESVAGLVVVILLVVSAVWILSEGINSLINPEPISISVWALIFMGGAVIINEVMARIKFYFGRKFSSIGLVADGQHSRADVVASTGVFLGLLLVKIWTGADALVAILVGIYILWESYKLSREVYDSLSDVASEEAENQIRNILAGFGVKILEIKTRKIGPATFAEIELGIDPEIKAKEVSLLSEKIKKKLLASIKNLKQVVISFKSKEVEVADIEEATEVKEDLGRVAPVGRLAGLAAARARGWGLGRGVKSGWGQGLGRGRGFGGKFGFGRGLGRGRR